MTEFIRTAEENFADLPNFPYVPNYHQWQDLRMHYVDEGPRDGPIMLLLHGMPTWAFLYRDMIPGLVEAGYRCIAPDHMGFGRSDKPTDIHWYTIARHTEILTSLIVDLDLSRITLVCQDWGGPTGLAQAAMMPERFDHLVIMNTWLHHPEYTYSDGITSWNRNWHEGGRFHRPEPDLGLLLVLSAGLLSFADFVPALTEGQAPKLSGIAKEMYRGFAAPYKGLPDEGYNGMRRFPLSIPLTRRGPGPKSGRSPGANVASSDSLAPRSGELDSVHNGNAAAQTLHYRTLLNWEKGCHFIWGCQDNVFTEAWGRQWASRMGARFDAVEDAGHFPQNTHGQKVASLILDGSP